MELTSTYTECDDLTYHMSGGNLAGTGRESEAFRVEYRGHLFAIVYKSMRSRYPHVSSYRDFDDLYVCLFYGERHDVTLNSNVRPEKVTTFIETAALLELRPF